MPARSTSQWVTMRISYSPVGLARIWRAASEAEISAAVRPVSRTSKMTMFVCTFRRSTLDAWESRQALGQVARVGVIFVQTRGRILQSDQSRGGQHADLAHPAAEELAIHARFFDELARADQHGTNRRAESFREAKHHGVEFARQFGDGVPQRRGCIENARAVKMHRQAGVVGAIANILRHIRRIDRAARHIVRTLQADQRGLRAVIDVRPDQRLDPLPA